MTLRAVCLALCALLLATPALADGYLHADGKRIVDGSGKPVILRGMGLGGWMLQEGYMLQLGKLGQQHVIRGKIADLVGEKHAAEFYEAWLDNHTREPDIKAMGQWGFNSVRLPIHFDLLTLPVDQEPVAGVDTWYESGFRRIDDLLAWSKANGVYLILDLHAAPGGQGNDLAISDRDPTKPSLWDSPENQRKTIALWRKLAARYANEPWIGGYDLINEPNWSFATPGKGNGCDEKTNGPVRDLQMRITKAIREVDDKHLIIVEGNCWGNNYAGVLPKWDGNIALSFHKYWNVNTPDSIAPILKLRDDNAMPVWLGESGENSNVWFADSIRLVEGEGIGWAFWPLKKIGFNQPLEITPNPGWAKLVAYWTEGGPKPEVDEAYATLMRLARHDIRFEANVQHPDVIDAMFRQPGSDVAKPFGALVAGQPILAADYDLGRAGVAYADNDLANYHVSTGKERTPWNRGRTYRNDGVDIGREADGTPFVSDFEPGEWLRYTIVAARDGSSDVTIRATTPVSVGLNGAPVVAGQVGTGEGRWKTFVVRGLRLKRGANVVRVEAGPETGQFLSLEFSRS
jgi:endoglucanase